MTTTARLSWDDLTNEQQDQIAEIYFDRDSRTKERRIADIAVLREQWNLNPSVRTLMREARRLGNYKQRRLKSLAESLSTSLPKSPKQQYLDYHIIETDNIAILGDIEIPDHRLSMLSLFLLTAIQHNIKQCVIAGDLVATDQSNLNSYLTTWIEQEAPFASDVSVMRSVIEKFIAWFDAVYMVEGNHDNRVARKTSGQVHLGMFLMDYKNLYYSRYDYLYLKTSRGFVRVCHPMNHFSSDPVKLAQDLYNSERGPYWPDQFHKTHIVLGHCHRSQSGLSPDGAFECHSIGMMRDVTRTQYRQQHTSKHKQWDNGFMIIRNGYMHNLSLRTTDWREWLGDLYFISPFVSPHYGDFLKDAYTGLNRT